MKRKNLTNFLVLVCLGVVLNGLVSETLFSLETKKIETASRLASLKERSEQLLNLLEANQYVPFAQEWKNDKEALISGSEELPQLQDLREVLHSVDSVVDQTPKRTAFNKAEVEPKIAFVLSHLVVSVEEVSRERNRLRMFRAGSQLLILGFLIFWILYGGYKRIGTLNRFVLLLNGILSGQKQKLEQARELKAWPTGIQLLQNVNALIQGAEECQRSSAVLEKKLKACEKHQEITDFVMANLPVGVVVNTLSNRNVLLVNKAFKDIYGFSPNFVDELETYQFKGEGQRLPITGYTDSQLRDDKKQVILTDKGEYRSVEVATVNNSDQDIQVSYYSEQGDLEGGEGNSVVGEALSEMIFNTAEVGLALVDQEGKLRKVNSKLCGISGYSQEELEGKHFSLLLPDNQVSKYKAAYQERMLKMAPLSTPLTEVQVENKKKEMLFVLSSSRIVYGPQFKGTIYSVLDITDMKTNQGKLQAAIQGSRIGTWNINVVTGHNEVNDCWARMLGYRKSEIMPDRAFFESLIHPEDTPRFKREVARISTGEQEVFNMEIRLRCKDGKYKWILDTGKVIKWNSDGTPLLMAGSHIDIDTLKKAQIEITKNRDRLRRAQEMGMLGDWELGLPDMQLTCSGMVHRIFGKKKSDENLDYQDFLSQFHPVSAVRLKRDIQKVIKKRVSISLEAEIFTESGNLKYVKLIAVPILGAEEEVVKLSGIIQDVTSLKTTKENLMETSKRLQVLSDNFPGGLIQLKVSPFLPPQILYLSKGAERSWGISREEALEGDVNRLLGQVHPNDHGVMKRSLQVASKKMERVSITWRTVGKDGTVHWHRGIGIPSRNKDQSITWNGLILDITERKLAENKVKEQDAYLQVLTEHASDAIAACDRNGNLIFYNLTFQAWFGGWRKVFKEENSKGAVELLSIDEERSLKKSDFSLFVALNEGKVQNHEFIVKREGKPPRYVQASGSALYDSATRTKMGAMVVIRDITDRIHKEIEVSNAILHARERERATIAADIHDGITQSLGVISMRLKNLGLDHQELVTDQGYLKAMNYLSNTIDQSRNLAHTLMPNSIQDFGLIVALEELVDQASSGTDTKVKFTHSGDQRIPAGKELHVFRVLQEGLGNALKHAKCSEIHINITIKTDFMVATLRDNGVGFNVQKSYLRNGIGLLSMRDRIKKIKGKFRVLSGKDGTVIWIRVPLEPKNKQRHE